MPLASRIPRKARLSCDLTRCSPYYECRCTALRLRGHAIASTVTPRQVECDHELINWALINPSVLSLLGL